MGNDVWYGKLVKVAGCVTIHDGAIVAAFSDVVKHVPPYTVVGGNPAQIIRTRFTEPQRSHLLRIQWWNIPTYAH